MAYFTFWKKACLFFLTGACSERDAIPSFIHYTLSASDLSILSQADNGLSTVNHFHQNNRLEYEST
jgi:hypothetical protein